MEKNINSELIIKSKVWKKDTFELIDYLSDETIKTKIKINSSGVLSKNDKIISFTQGEDIPKSPFNLLTIKKIYSTGKFIINCGDWSKDLYKLIEQQGAFLVYRGLTIKELNKNVTYSVLVGVNLLREGLDLPEVSLVAILDADKEGFLRSYRSLTQTIGRAARNVNGKAILYCDKETDSIHKTIEETNRRRQKQMAYNAEHHITPTQIRKAQVAIEEGKHVDYVGKAYIEEEFRKAAEDPIVMRMDAAALDKSIEHSRTLMQQAAKRLDFVLAAQYRDEMLKLEEIKKNKEKE